MAIEDDFSVAVNGDIRHTGGATNYTVLELHRMLQDLADDASASGDDLVDITSDTPSDRSTDQIIDLLGTYNIDDDAAEYLYGGSITQASGATRYSGVRVLGAVNSATTQLMIYQGNEQYQFTTTPATPFWGDQSGGGYNGDTTNAVLMRCLIKSRDNGADIDEGKIRVQARHWGDSFDFFEVTLGLAESVAAISTTPDAQNDTAQGTVTAYTHIVNSGGTANDPTGGFQLIDLTNGNGSLEYYSKWTFGADLSGDGLKGMWEYHKDLVGTGTAKTTDGLNGELFLGISHSFAYDAEVGGPFTERETLVWGTEVRYDTYLADDADLVLVSYGYSSRVCKEAINRVRKDGLKVGLVRPITLWPFPYEPIREKAEAGCKILVVEDSLGQMIDDVKVAVPDGTQVDLLGLLSRHLPDDGGMLLPGAVVNEIRRIL